MRQVGVESFVAPSALWGGSSGDCQFD